MPAKPRTNLDQLNVETRIGPVEGFQSLGTATIEILCDRPGKLKHETIRHPTVAMSNGTFPQSVLEPTANSIQLRDGFLEEISSLRRPDVLDRGITANLDTIPRLPDAGV